MYKLLYVPNPLLRQQAKKIEYVNDENLKIAKTMKEVMMLSM